jgi:hypothetical protein
MDCHRKGSPRYTCRTLVKPKNAAYLERNRSLRDAHLERNQHDTDENCGARISWMVRVIVSTLMAQSGRIASRIGWRE